MNKRDREQLKASIAKDLVEGQGEHSPTRELLKQYAPLEGIVAAPEAANSRQPLPAEPVENGMACGATLAQDAESAWHGARVAPHATLALGATPAARYAMVKGELRVPNTVNFSLFPTLEPYAKAVYYQLFLLSHGFRRDTCLISLPKLASLVLMSQRKVQNTIVYLEKRGLIKRLDSRVTGPCRGNLYQVPLPVAEPAPESSIAPGATLAGGASLAPHATLAPDATPAPRATNKEKPDDDLKENHHQRPERTSADGETAENHSRAATPLEKPGSPDRHFAVVRKAYEQATGNRWNKSDTEAYEQNNLRNFPAEKIMSVMDTVARRTPARINSLAYFVKEIVTRPDPRNRAWQKKQLEKIVRRIRDNAVGRAGFSIGDLAESVKRACARDGILFDHDVFNELAG